MAENGNVPDNWYQYEWPLPEIPAAPKPSQANYDPRNVAWMIEMFASVLGKSHTEIQFQYENNTPNDPNDDIVVEHPDDKLYWPDYNTGRLAKSPEQERYEMYAKQSARLKLFQDNSPAGIEYFQ